MFRAAMLFLAWTASSVPAQSQTSQPANQTDETRALEAVLSEIRQLRQDLQIAANAARKAQIIIYRLHYQQNALDRASERLENTQNNLFQVEQQRKYWENQLKSLREALEKADGEEQRKQLESGVAATDERLQECAVEEQELRIKASELEVAFHAEQAKWEQLTAELEQIENSIENVTLQAAEKR
jgi:chromosome segregation ATPase